MTRFVVNARGPTPALIAAARAGKSDVVHAVLGLTAGFRPRPPRADDSGYAAVRAAAEGGHADVVQQLLSSISYPPCINGPCIVAAAKGGSERVLRLLLEAGLGAAAAGAAMPPPPALQRATAADMLGKGPRGVLLRALQLLHQEQLAYAPPDLLHLLQEQEQQQEGAGCWRSYSTAELKIIRDLAPCHYWDEALEEAGQRGAEATTAAARQGFEGVVRLLVPVAGHGPPAPAPVHPLPSFTDSPLQAAVERGDAQAVHELLRSPECTERASDGLHLECAARLGHVEVAEQLVYAPSHPAQPNARGELLVAAMAGHTTMVAFLLGQRPAPAWAGEGASSRVTWARADDRDGAALLNAVYRGHLGCISLLLSVPQHPARATGQAVVCAARRGHARAVEMLLEAGAALEQQGVQALWGGLVHNSPEVVRQLLQRGVRDASGGALVEAASRGLVQVLEVMLDAAYSGPLEHKIDALEAAARLGHEQVIRLLVDHHGVRADSRNSEALRTAVKHTRMRAVEELLHAPGHPQARAADAAAATPTVLRWHCKGGKLWDGRRILELLLDAL